MIEFLWPWVFVLLPLPLIVRYAVPRAGIRDAALFVPFFQTLTKLDAKSNHRATRSVVVAVLAWRVMPRQ